MRWEAKKDEGGEEVGGVGVSCGCCGESVKEQNGRRTERIGSAKRSNLGQLFTRSHDEL